MEARPRKVQNYLDPNGNDPYYEWFKKLRDGQGKAVIAVKIKRVEEGNFGDHKSVGRGVSELRIKIGPGYRVYYGEDGDTVILLGGGDKSTQAADINLAIKRWENYNAQTD